MLNSPCNPTGSMMQQEELAKIASLALRHRFFIISDEIYSEIVFDGRKHVSIANLEPRVKELTITVNGFSKAYAMTGWRVGYAAGPGPIITAMGNVQGHFTSGTNTMAQKAAIAAVYGPQDFIREMVEEYDRRRRHIVKRLNSNPGDFLLLSPRDVLRVPGRVRAAEQDLSGDAGPEHPRTGELSSGE